MANLCFPVDVASKIGTFTKDSVQCVAEGLYKGLCVDRIGRLLTLIFERFLTSIQGLSGMLIIGCLTCLNFLLVKLVEFIEGI